MKILFCTLFDRHYLARALVMVRSLRRHAGQRAPPVVALCLDDATLGYLHEFPEPGVVPLALADLEAADPALAAARADRSRLEYYFTLSPCLPRHLLLQGGLDGVVSLDADLWFTRDPTPLVRALEARPLLITAHGFSPAVARGAAATGRFNVSFQGFRDDAVGRACLDRWRRQCLEWCENRIDRKGRYADQAYLDPWPDLYPGSVTILEPPTAGLAPWNLARFRIAGEDDPSGLTASGRKPVFFHFHGVRFIRHDLVADNLWRYRVDVEAGVIDHLYGPYLRELSRVQEEVSSRIGDDQPLSGALRGVLLPAALWQARSWFRLSSGSITHRDISLLHPVDAVRRAWNRFRHPPIREADLP